MKGRLPLILAVAVALLSTLFTEVKAADPSETNRTVVLDTAGFWRMHHRLEPPFVAADGAPEPILFGKPWVDDPTPAAPAGWTDPDFDDAGWLRLPLRRQGRTPYLSRLCLRGKFRVADPAEVNGLALTAEYHGGIVVYLNGREVLRRHLPAGPLAADTLADAYPREAFLNENGELMGSEMRRHWRLGRNRELAPHVALSRRGILKAELPVDALREGVNVLAVQIVRAPYNPIIEEKRTEEERGHGYNISWNTCQINRLQLTAEDAGGLVPNAVRPAGLQVWNGDPMIADFDLDFGDPNEPLRPVRIVGARNGWFSGEVLVGSDGPITGLRARAGDLEGDGGVIPASAVRVRFGLPWGEQRLVYPYQGHTLPYPAAPGLLGALAEEAPGEVPVYEKPTGRGHLDLPGQPQPVFGAVVPVWITVKVPTDVPPGVYRGQVKLEADARAAVDVLVEVDVRDWTVPDPAEHATWVEMVQSPETLAMEYEVEPWSQRHLELIAQSMRYIRDAGSRVLYVPLICHTHYGNDESMVRWIPDGNGGYSFDFSRMDAYLDVAEKHLGTPGIVVFQVWDVYMMPTDESELGRGDRRVYAHLEKTGALMGAGPEVTVRDPETGEFGNVFLPRYGEPGTAEHWSELFARLRERMKARGLEGTMMLGLLPDQWATQEEIAFLKEVSGDLPWVVHSHMGATRGNVYDIARAGYQTRVWHVYYATEPAGEGSLLGWKEPLLVAKFNRIVGFDTFPYATWSTYPEFAVTGSVRGVGRLGADFWNVIKDKRGRRRGTVTQLYPQSSWRNLDPWAALLAPGPDGPVATTRYEVMREGVQACEARIFIERALADDASRAKLGEELAARAEELLRERLRCMWRQSSHMMLIPKYSIQSAHTDSIAGSTWFAGSDWRGRLARLYDTAGQIADRLATP